MNNEESIEYIEHSAIVESVDLYHRIIKVRINNDDECGECPAARLCQTNGRASNLVDVRLSSGISRYKKGDIVTVRGTERMHRKAIMYATVLPCIALVAVMVAVYVATGNQLTAAISGLSVTIIFFMILWGARNKIAHEFSFTIVGAPERAGEER